MKLPLSFRVAAVVLGTGWVGVLPGMGDAATGQRYLKASNTGRQDNFGWVMAASGDTLVVGAPGEASSATAVNGDQLNNKAAGAGAVYVFVRSGSTWVQQAYLKASNSGAGDQFGYSVAIDGDVIVVGAPYEDGEATTNGGTNGGTVTVGGNGVTVTATGPAITIEQPAGTTLTDGGTKSFGTVGLGGSTSLTFTVRNAGDSILSDFTITKDGTNSSDFTVTNLPSGTNIGPNGSATFSVQFQPQAAGVRTAAIHVTSNSATNNPFDIILTGTGSSGGGGGGGGGSGQIGAAYVFTRTGSTWTQQAKLKAEDGEKGDFFGAAVAVSGETVVVGATHESSAASGVDGNAADNSYTWAGAAYVFTRSGTSWSQQAYLKASNPGPSDFFGRAVAIDGDTVVVGAADEDGNATGVNGAGANNTAAGAGAAYVFVRDGSTWFPQAYLKASNTGAGDAFGRSLAVSGDTVVVGAPSEDSNAIVVDGDGANNAASGAGAAYVFVRDDDDQWSQQAYLKASNSGKGDNFGWSVAIRDDVVMVGAPGEDSNATGLDSDGANNSAAAAGAAYLFRRGGNVWEQETYFKASNTGKGDHYGWSVAVGNGTAVGAPDEDSAATGVNADQTSNKGANSGAVYVSWSALVVEQPAGTVVAAGATKDFGAVTPGGGKELTFTLRNVGDVGLSGLSVAMSGTDAGSFTVTTQPSASLAPGASSTFAVRFAPATTGNKTAVMTVIGGTSYAVTVTGVGATPQVAVEQPFGTAVASGSTRNMGTIGQGSTGELTFKVTNSGEAGLTGVAVDITGTDAGDFQVISQPSETLAAGATSTFTVQFSPLGGGNKTATLAITSDAPGDSLFVLTLTGRGAAAEIVVEQPVGTNLTDNSTQSFGTVAVGGFADLTFTIKNVGEFALTGISISQSGPNAAEFTVTSQPAGELSAGSETTFSVRFSPLTVGDKVASLNIANSDADENPFDLTLTGRGSGPEIVVEQPPGTDRVNNAEVNFGSTAVGGYTTVAFKIRNTGNLPLEGVSVSKSGTNAADFSVLSDPPLTIAAGAEATFQVRFTPASAAARTAVLSIASNDLDENPFTVHLLGQGTTPSPAPARAAAVNAALPAAAQDTDNDGMSDQAEQALAALGFDWQVPNKDLVATYFAAAGLNGLAPQSTASSPTQPAAPALEVKAPVVTWDPETGAFKLTVTLEKSADGVDFETVPLDAEHLTISPDGTLQLFVLPSKDTNFFRLDAR